MRLAVRYVLSPALALLLAGVVHAQTSSPPGASQGQVTQTYPYTMPLYRNPDVARDLSLTPAQVDRLNRETGRLQTRYRADWDQLSDRERAARRQDLAGRYNADWLRSAGTILNEQQVDRYRQLELQSRGLDAYTDPAVQRRLTLTDAQIRQLAELRDQRATEARNIHPTDRLRTDDSLRRWRDFEVETENRINRILTENQLRRWRDMTGRPFNFPPSGPTPAPGGTGR
jgi:hypothetical protein